MDFMQRLQGKINEIPGLPATCVLGYLGVAESLVLYPLPGSRTVIEYMDGTKDQQLNYEIAMKSKSSNKINSALWMIQNELEQLEKIESQNNSFQFEGIVITSKPFINQIDDQDWFVFLLNVQANITVLKEEKKNG
ncbi:minor capsid protein [Planomicrobium sp. YIM 101495]|uniref:phage tail terminator protein n=1 Tax=Planomicrobium sp. YIM 101495 TaxID=2665160 RepID=UPI0012B9FA24|nr:minor capsid protein [Planomicrobium sp. YIM 101495]MTD30160.1 capsid protein [Planomicrobium sp. YIM 101495]